MAAEGSFAETAPGSSAKCEDCNYVLSPEWNFCPICARNIDLVCSQCLEPISMSFRFCPHCAKPNPRFVDRKWVLIFRQTMPYFYKPEELTKNPDDDSKPNYAILDQLKNHQFKGCDGKYHFKLKWPKDDKKLCFEWKQSSNPLETEVAGTCAPGYEAVKIPHGAKNGWGGLRKDSKGCCILNGSCLTSGNWFYALGTFKVWNDGYPGQSSAVSAVELWGLRAQYVRK